MNENGMTVQKILSHEVTKVLFIAGLTFSLVKMVILPLQEIQIKLAQVQLDILEIKGYKETIDGNSTDIVILKEKLKQYNIK